MLKRLKEASTWSAISAAVGIIISAPWGAVADHAGAVALAVGGLIAAVKGALHPEKGTE